MHKGFWLLIFFILGALLFCYTLREVGVEGVVSFLSMLKAWQALLIFWVLFTSVVLIGGYKWWLIVGSDKKDGAKLSKMTIAKLIGYSISYVTPSSLIGGEPAKVLYLKQETKLSTSRIISSIILDELMVFSLIIMVFFMGLFFLLIYMHLSWMTEIIGLGLVGGAMLAFLLIMRRVKKVSAERGLLKTIAERFFLNRLRVVRDNMGALDEIENDIKDFFHKPKKELMKIFIIALFEFGALLSVAWLILAFLGVRLDITRLFVVRSVIDFSGFFPLPASLGTLEATEAFAVGSLGLDSAVGVAFSLIWRGLNLVLSACGLAVFMFIQFKFLSRKFVRLAEILAEKIKK